MTALQKKMIAPTLEQLTGMRRGIEKEGLRVLPTRWRWAQR